MINNTLLEAILISRALCHCEVPPAAFAGRARRDGAPAEPAAFSPSPGPLLRLGGFSIDTGSGAVLCCGGEGRAAGFSMN